MADGAVHVRHIHHFQPVTRVADLADHGRRSKAMYGGGVAPDTGDVLLLGVLSMTGSCCYLPPLRITVLVAVLAGLVLHGGMLLHPLRAGEDEGKELTGTGKHALVVTLVTADFGVAASGPAVP